MLSFNESSAISIKTQSFQCNGSSNSVGLGVDSASVGALTLTTSAGEASMQSSGSTGRLGGSNQHEEREYSNSFNRSGEAVMYSDLVDEEVIQKCMINAVYELFFFWFVFYKSPFESAGAVVPSQVCLCSF